MIKRTGTKTADGKVTMTNESFNVAAIAEMSQEQFVKTHEGDYCQEITDPVERVEALQKLYDSCVAESKKVPAGK